MISKMLDGTKGDSLSRYDIREWRTDDPLFSNFMALMLVLVYDKSPTEALMAMGLLGVEAILLDNTNRANEKKRTQRRKDAREKARKNNRTV